MMRRHNGLHSGEPVVGPAQRAVSRRGRTREVGLRVRVEPPHPWPHPQPYLRGGGNHRVRAWHRPPARSRAMGLQMKHPTNGYMTTKGAGDMGVDPAGDTAPQRFQERRRLELTRTQHCKCAEEAVGRSS